MMTMTTLKCETQSGVQYAYHRCVSCNFISFWNAVTLLIAVYNGSQTQVVGVRNDKRMKTITKYWSLSVTIFSTNRGPF